MTTFQPSPGPDAAPTSDQVSPRDSGPDQPTSVARLNQTIKSSIDRWGSVWVEGEITQWNVRGRNVFGGMKDLTSDAQVNLQVWSNVVAQFTDDFHVGDHVIACLKADYFVKRGSFSFQVASMKHVGLGTQLERLEKLRRQLQKEGLFAASRKKALPFLPSRIGLITGAGSDAEKDVLRNSQLRWPQVEFHTIHATVQGDRSVPEILAALEQLDADPEVDVIIIARGGGDPQTLLGFSDEKLVRAVAAATTPVVSAIGHENDRPLLDEVADLRASTPTDAAKRVVPDVGEQRALVGQLRARLTTRLQQQISHGIQQVEQIRSRPSLRDPDSMIRSRQQEVFLSLSRGRDLMARGIDRAERRTGELRASLRALSPASTLARGYAIAQLADGSIVRDSASAPDGAALTITLDEGAIAATSHGSTASAAAPSRK
ncbi:exodeoxyribonuclease 7 large subunit [Microbacterium sorbitolivorans]|uniref:Exodeoxyribonuclease 7 large subunit n=1 Tax=Microbacterium sorbitolivorans TaxID=1867410 RepID=A0A367Y8F4_9MICO|nr:exodeoxyribonuclease VII large subunit [Microbacterium sorbitolivorans]RCK61281.1 exodeoxyribonuclease VII large subunit [Microbacterium sorbitolivorans]GGF33516.1 exodeoxyribonuclease 7 large subunit [Microbacterium sorbitolivorans]